MWTLLYFQIYMYHAKEDIASQNTRKPWKLVVALIVLTTLFAIAWNKIVLLHFLLAYP